MKMDFRILLLTLLLVFASCRNGTDRAVVTIKEAMEPFIYVGDSPDLPNREVGDHRSARVTFPNHLVKGRQYIFHRKHTSDESWIVMENSLRANGATIVNAPRGNIGLVFSYIGGPWYVIDFRMGQLNCYFQNYPARELGAGGLPHAMEQEDFILRIE